MCVYEWCSVLYPRPLRQTGFISTRPGLNKCIDILMEGSNRNRVIKDHFETLLDPNVRYDTTAPRHISSAPVSNHSLVKMGRVAVNVWC